MGERRTILVAEDDESGRDLLTQLLRHWGYDVLTTPTGDEALTLLRSRTDLEIALLDWMMPGISGPEICRIARADPALESRYLVLVTARSSREDLVEGLGAGADDFVTKPVDADELHSRIRVGERIVSLQSRLAKRVEELQKALSRVRRLEGLIPICAYCKRVRNEEAYWERVEQYVQSRSTARFSHGICPECLAREEAKQEGMPGPAEAG